MSEAIQQLKRHYNSETLDTAIRHVSVKDARLAVAEIERLTADLTEAKRERDEAETAVSRYENTINERDRELAEAWGLLAKTERDLHYAKSLLSLVDSPCSLDEHGSWVADCKELAAKPMPNVARARRAPMSSKLVNRLRAFLKPPHITPSLQTSHMVRDVLEHRLIAEGADEIESLGRQVEQIGAERDRLVWLIAHGERVFGSLWREATQADIEAIRQKRSEYVG